MYLGFSMIVSKNTNVIKKMLILGFRRASRVTGNIHDRKYSRLRFDLPKANFGRPRLRPPVKRCVRALFVGSVVRASVHKSACPSAHTLGCSFARPPAVRQLVRARPAFVGPSVRPCARPPLGLLVRLSARPFVRPPALPHACPSETSSVRGRTNSLQLMSGGYPHCSQCLHGPELYKFTTLQELRLNKSTTWCGHSGYVFLVASPCFSDGQER